MATLGSALAWWASVRAEELGSAPSHGKLAVAGCSSPTCLLYFGYFLTLDFVSSCDAFSLMDGCMDVSRLSGPGPVNFWSSVNL
jgi:hypothetical protein